MRPRINNREQVPSGRYARSDWCWLLTMFSIAALLGLVLGFALAHDPDQAGISGVLYELSSRAAPTLLQFLFIAGMGAVFIGFALFKLYHVRPDLGPAVGHAGVNAAQPIRRTNPVVPRVVAIGGGHGLSALLRGLKTHPCDLTAIVTVADDGGSSGILRREIGMLPPGDLRRCIVALAEAEPLMTQLFQYRFGKGASLQGHAFGNLFIAAMMGVTGDFETAIMEASRVLAVQGRIIPSSLDNILLCAEVSGNDAQGTGPRILRGQASIAKSQGIIERVYLQPEDARGYPEAIKALLQADMILLGPGSLYTSILPNLLVDDICSAIRASSGLKMYICNVASQPGETDGFTVGDHVRALGKHLGDGFCSYVLANSNLRFALPEQAGSQLVRPDLDSCSGYQLILEDLVDTNLPWRHDSAKLASAVFRLYDAHGRAPLA